MQHPLLCWSNLNRPFGAKGRTNAIGLNVYLNPDSNPPAMRKNSALSDEEPDFTKVFTYSYFSNGIANLAFTNLAISNGVRPFLSFSFLLAPALSSALMDSEAFDLAA